MNQLREYNLKRFDKETLEAGRFIVIQINEDFEAVAVWCNDLPLTADTIELARKKELDYIIDTNAEYTAVIRITDKLLFNI